MTTKKDDPKTFPKYAKTGDATFLRIDDVDVFIPITKTLHNSDISGAKKNVSDLKVVGDGDLFQLLSKASSENEGWMKSTKTMEITGVGCLVQVTTQQRNPDWSYAVAEALTFVPGVCVQSNAAGKKLVEITR